mgnify:CR=1 FL=1
MSFSARLSTALLCVVWASEIVRIFQPVPWLAGLGAACLATYMAMALGRASAHIRAVFVLAQSRRPEARRAVVEAAQRGPEMVRIAAIREMGRFQGANVNAELMQVYSTAGTPRVKRQIVSSLGGRADTSSLLRIARVETDASVRNTAIVMLGRTGGREQLRTLYRHAPSESRPAVLSAMFNARDDDGLIAIARTERDSRLRWRAREQLSMLATPKAVKFLAENP